MTLARCPRCDSHAPELHPAMQHGGEVQLCPCWWHASTDQGRRALAKAQPAAPTRTEAEQRVLDAMGLIREAALRRLRKDNRGSVADAIDAELARRGLKP
jgi:hypothetical protein